MSIISDIRSGDAPIKNRHARVTEELGLAIVRGDFKPGESLPPEIQICEMMGVSRTATREAIKGLFAKGLVASKPKLGTRVREASAWNHLDPDVLRWRLEVSDTETYLIKMFQLRHATEPAACALAAVNAQEHDCVHIQAAFQAMVDAGDDKNAWVEADLDFHKSIYMATHNEFFWPIGQLFGFGLRHMFNISALGPHRPRAVLEHGALVEAIIGHDPEKARTTALTLLENAKKDIDLIRGAIDRS